MVRLGSSDYEAVLAIVAELLAADPTEPLPPMASLDAIRRLIPSADTVAYFEGRPPLDHARRVSGAFPPWTVQDKEALDRFKWQDPLFPTPAALGVARRATDLMSRSAWRRTDLYNLVGRSHGLEYGLNAWHRGASGVWRGLFVDGAHEFTERDRQVLDVVARYMNIGLDRLERRGWSIIGTAGLTRRQVDILRLAAAGLTNQQIAARLTLSPYTVRKHLENAFDRLGVHSRAAAVAAAYDRGVLDRSAHESDEARQPTRP